MKDARLEILHAKELDGDLTDLERVELDRRVLLSPGLRRERAGWARIFAVLAHSGGRRRLRVEAMARIIVQEVDLRDAVARSRPRRAAFAATLLAACSALFALTGLPPEPPAHPTRVAQLSTGPVQLELGLDPPDEEDVAPVTIRF